MLHVKEIDIPCQPTLNLPVKQVSPVTSIKKDNGFVIGGAFVYILKLSRLFGMAPLRFEAHLKGYTIFISTAMTIYSYIFVAVVGSAALIGKIVDMNTSSHITRSKLSQMVSFNLVFIVVLMAVVGAIGAPKRMRNMFSNMRTIASVDRSICAQYSPVKERKLLLLTAFFLIFVAAMIVHDIYSAWNKGWIPFLSRSSLLVAWYSVVILNLQFVFTAMSVCARFHAVNETLAVTTRHFSLKLDKTVLPDTLNIFAIHEAPRQSVADGTQIVIVRKSIIAEPRLIVSPTVAVQIITLLRGKLCDVLYIVDESYGLPIIIMLLCIIGYIIVTPYYIISHINDPATSLNTHYTLSMSIWCLIYVTQLFIIVEPCHNTIKEAKNTKSLVCRMMMSSPVTNSIYIRLELLFQQLLMQTDSYEPMGMCTLSRSLVVSIFGAVITYLVILVQFQNDG